MLIDMAANTAIKLAPHLKMVQLEAMTNGDEYIPILPNFKIYQTWLSHGHSPSQISMDVLIIKCKPRDVKLLGEFFMQLAPATTNNHCDGIYLPKGVAYLLGLQTYAQVLQENIFQSNVATIPDNLEYNA